MAANPYTRVLNDPNAAVPGTDALHRKKEMGPTGDTEIVSDPLGITMKCGRGVSDPLVTYFVLYNTNGQAVYFYPNAAGNGLIFSLVQP